MNEDIIKKYNMDSAVSASKMLARKELSLEDRVELFITPKYIPFPRNSVSIIAAEGGSGKTFLSIIEACEYVLSEYEKGKDPKVLLWLSEDPDYIVADRFRLVVNLIREYSDKQIEIIKDRLFFWTASSHMPFYFAEQRGSRFVENAKVFNAFKEVLDKKEIDLLILDPLLNFFGGEENSNSHARFFINLLNKWAMDTKKTIILLHHAGKGEGSFSRGASAFIDSARFVVTLKRIKMLNENRIEVDSDREPDIYQRDIIIKKDNYGAPSLLRKLDTNFTDTFRYTILPQYLSFEEKLADIIPFDESDEKEIERLNSKLMKEIA